MIRLELVRVDRAGFHPVVSHCRHVLRPPTPLSLHWVMWCAGVGNGEEKREGEAVGPACDAVPDRDHWAVLVAVVRHSAVPDVPVTHQRVACAAIAPESK